MATTRASLKIATGKQNITGKRKAELSPLKNERVKRFALTNLTNNLNPNEAEENGKKFTVVTSKKEDNVPNIQPISYRTRAAAAAASTTENKGILLKPPTKGLKKLKPIHENEKEKTVGKNKSGGVDDIVTTLKSKHSNDAQSKSSITSRRISNEFEKTEESLYVSALEDIPSDASRLSYEKIKSQPVLVSSSSVSSQEERLSSSSNSSDLSVTLLSSDNEEVFEDAVCRKLPSGMQHFDRENWNDPYQVSHYSMNIFEYLKEREFHYKIKDYMPNQPELSKWMRSLLVDWMVEVQESFELNHETLYLAIKIVDTYLGYERVPKDSLQLLGAAALLIACKYDERTPPLVDDFLFICDGAYKRNQLLKMEMSAFRAINYDLGFPLSYRFLRRYARCGKVSMLTLTLARYILEYSLMDYSTIQLSDSKMACAALFIALRMNNCDGWNESLEYYSGYKLMEFAPIVVLLNTLLHKKPKETLSTVRNKYSHKIFHQVTSIPLMDVNTLFEKFTDVTQKLSLSQLTYQTVIATCSASSTNVEGKSSTGRNKITKDAPLSTKAMPVPLIR